MLCSATVQGEFAYCGKNCERDYGLKCCFRQETKWQIMKSRLPQIAGWPKRGNTVAHIALGYICQFKQWWWAQFFLHWHNFAQRW
jgi:hypothetical protein